MADDDKPAEAPAEQPIDLDAPIEEIKEEPKAEEPKEGEEPDAGADDAGTDDKPKKPSGAQRAKAREARLLNELSEAQRRIDELSRKTPANAGEAEEKEPVEADFNGDFFAYQQAATAFKAGKAVRDALKAERETREQSERSTRQADLSRERREAHLERVEDAREVIADFDTVMKEMDGIQVRQDVIDEIMASDKSALLAYHLAKNPDKLQTLNRMTGTELAREMGRLEGSVRMPAANKQTKAPPPLDPLRGGASAEFDPSKSSMDDYVAKRKAGWKG